MVGEDHADYVSVSRIILGGGCVAMVGEDHVDYVCGCE